MGKKAPKMDNDEIQSLNEFGDRTTLKHQKKSKDAYRRKKKYPKKYTIDDKYNDEDVNDDL